MRSSSRSAIFGNTVQEQFKRRNTRRLLWSSAVALVLVGLLIFLGPSRETVRNTFDFIGAEGPLIIMQELSIEDGRDRVDQVEEFLQENPPPPSYEIEDVPPDDSGLPMAKQTTDNAPLVESTEYSDSVADPDLDNMDLVEMNMAQMTNPNYTLIHFVKPQYPSLASEEDRRIPRVTVNLAIFVNRSGNVTAAYVLDSTASKVFEEVSLKAARQWKFKLNIDGPGIWFNCTIGFRGPYS